MNFYQIKFGTDGWREIIARDYTVDNVNRVADATARWMLSKDMKSAVIGYDCRFGGKMFAETTAKVFVFHGIKCYLNREFASTPMVSLAVVKSKADMGIVITASHNPPSYNGYKLKSYYGGPSIPADITEVESMIPDAFDNQLIAKIAIEGNSLIEYIDMEKMYLDHVNEKFDVSAIREGVNLAYDGMYGAGRQVIKKIFDNKGVFLHCDDNPGFCGRAPEPILKNLPEITALLKADSSLTIGLANDGDADRIGLFDENGNFVDSHHIILLLIYYLKEYKNYDGEVIVTFSTTDKVKKLCEHYGIPVTITGIGFKYIAELMLTKDVMVGGEESGGIAVKGHIPERDGIWIGLEIMELMAKSGKTLTQLIDIIYDKIGKFVSNRIDMHLTEEKKQLIIAQCNADNIKTLGDRAIIRRETIDGFKYFVAEDQWVLVRPSGTEPVLRVYAQTPCDTSNKALLSLAESALLDIN